MLGLCVGGKDDVKRKNIIFVGIKCCDKAMSCMPFLLHPILCISLER